MFRTAFHSMRQGAILSRRYASSGRAAPISRVGFAPKAALSVSLLAVAIMYPINQALNDVKEQVKEQTKELVEDASKQTETVKEDIKAAVTPDEKKPEDDSEKPEEAQAAFNPETGEINWDCPCLGGMAHGPCGEEFKEAFACFVYSETEPKGIDCIKKFEAMRTCFKQHPEHYKEELYEDDEVPSVETDASSEGTAAVTATVTDATSSNSEAKEVAPVTESIPSEGPSHAHSELPSTAPAEGANASDVSSLKVTAKKDANSGEEQPKL